VSGQFDKSYCFLIIRNIQDVLMCTNPSTKRIFKGYRINLPAGYRGINNRSGAWQLWSFFNFETSFLLFVLFL